jgi:beta-N-acetylhexosaminidase
MIDLGRKPFYLSRRDIAWVENTLACMTPEEKIGQLFCPIGMRFDEGFLLRMASGLKVGGIMFREAPAAQVRQANETLQRAAAIPLLLPANVETGGNGIASEGTCYGSQMNAAATGDSRCAETLGGIAAREGAAVGLNWAFGPVCDIDMNYRNPITNVRTFGRDPKTVLRMSRACARGLKANGLAACAKHFPGDGVDDRDQHLLTSVNTLSLSAWDRTYGRIYRALIRDGVMSVMAGHITLPAYQSDGLPATLSRELLQGLLRKQLSFHGLIITDATPMAGFCSAMERRTAIPYAIEAGCDMILFNKDIDEDFEYMRQGIASGILSARRLEEALTRILGMKAALRLHDRQAAGTLVPDADALGTIGCLEHLAEAATCADRSITLIKDEGCLLPLSPEKYPRILLEVVGGFGSDARVASTVKARLRKEGFEVTLYEPENLMTLDSGVERFRAKYDLALYLGNVETASNRTVSRISWHTLFGSGNNIPWFAKELPVVFAGVGNPYLMQDVPMVGTLINAYNNSDIILEMVADKLLGKSKFTGISPVDAYCGRGNVKPLYLSTRPGLAGDSSAEESR